MAFLRSVSAASCARSALMYCQPAKAAMPANSAAAAVVSR
jgi:hypothetical protein